MLPIRVIFRHSKSALLRSLRESMINMIFFTDPPGADAYIAGSDQVWDRSIRSIT